MDAATKQALLGLVDEACESGWSVNAALRYLKLPASRYYRWVGRGDDLKDRPAGGGAMHGLLDDEIEAILELFEEWGDTDHSHRRLAHRGSYLARFWVSPSTVRRVLNDADLRFRQPPRPAKSKKKSIPDWVTYRPNQVWIYDSTHFTRASMVVLIVMDLVSRKWISTVVAAEETSIQVELGFTRALEAEGIYLLLDQREEQTAAGMHGPHLPVLLAMSDNGPQMRSGATEEFMALCSIAQHFGRPGTPTDQAWIETLNGHIKGEYPQLTKIYDPATLRAELAVVREHYNGVRLHEAIGYVTPNDEHEGRGEAIRQARKEGMKRAHERRLATRRAARNNEDRIPPPDVA